MVLRCLLAAGAAALLAAAPASASELAPLKPCYVAAKEDQREPVMIGAKGFTPLSTVDVYVDDILQHSPRVGFDGELNGSVYAPWVEAGQRLFSLRLAEQGQPANNVEAISRVTRLAVEQIPARASTRDRVRFRGRGFTLAAPVYAHYVFAGKSRRTIRIGRPTGACGTFSLKRRQFPFKMTPRVGVWTIWFDQERVYNPKASLRVPLTIKVRPRIKPQPQR